MNEALKPYLARSLGLHAAAAAAFLLLSSRARPPSTAGVYSIDFVGPSAPSAAAVAAPLSRAASRPGRIEALRDPDAISRRASRGSTALPRPSLLAGEHDERFLPSSGVSLAGDAPPSPERAAAPPAPAAARALGAGVTTDVAQFPYPWYITQVRQMLWDAWRVRRPSFDAQGVLAFSILRDGSFTDLSTETSSGDAGFDAAAIAAVRAAAPFPPLPQGFHEPFLKIHLTVTSQSPWD